jgi:spore germination protein GerM
MSIRELHDQPGGAPPLGSPPGSTGGEGSGRSRRRRRWIAAGTVTVAVLAAAALGALVVDRDGDDADVAVDEPTTEAPATTAPATTVTEAPSASPGGSTAGPGTTATPAAESLDLTIWFIDDDIRLVPVEVTVPATEGVARAALTELLRGPGAAHADEYATTVPAGTRLLDVTVADGIATVDLSREFGSGGGSASMGARVAQVVYTLTEFDTVHSVRFLMEGTPVEALGGEGLMIGEPQTRADWSDFAP